MRTNNRWMTWVLDESANTTTAMPWTKASKGSLKSRALAETSEMRCAAISAASNMKVAYGKVAADIR